MSSEPSSSANMSLKNIPHRVGSTRYISYADFHEVKDCKRIGDPRIVKDEDYFDLLIPMIDSVTGERFEMQLFLGEKWDVDTEQEWFGLVWNYAGVVTRERDRAEIFVRSCQKNVDESYNRLKTFVSTHDVYKYRLPDKEIVASYFDTLVESSSGEDSIDDSVKKEDKNNTVIDSNEQI